MLDVGSIKFDRNTGSYHLEAANAVFNNWHEAVFANNTQVDQTLSAVFYNGDSGEVADGDGFSHATADDSQPAGGLGNLRPVVCRT